MEKKKKKLIYISSALILVVILAITPFAILYGAYFNPQKNNDEFGAVYEQLHAALVPALYKGTSDFSFIEKSWGGYNGIYIFCDTRAYNETFKYNKSFYTHRYKYRIFANKLIFSSDQLLTTNFDESFYDHPFFGNEIKKQNDFFDKQPIDWGIINDVPGKTDVYFNSLYEKDFSYDQRFSIDWHYTGPYAMVCKTQNTDESSIEGINTLNSLDTLRITNIFFKTSFKKEDIALGVPYFGDCSIESLEAYMKLNLQFLAQNQEIADIFLKSDLFGNININFAKRLEYINTQEPQIIGVALKSKKRGFITDDEYNIISNAGIDLLSVQLIDETGL